MTYFSLLIFLFYICIFKLRFIGKASKLTSIFNKKSALITQIATYVHKSHE